MNEFTKAGIQKKRQSLFNRKSQTVEYTGSTHTHTHTHTEQMWWVSPDTSQILQMLRYRYSRVYPFLIVGIASPSHNFSLGSSPPTYY